MSQAVLFLALHLIGVAVCLAVGPRRRVWLCCALGFAVGLALAVILIHGLLATGLPYELWTLAALGAIVLGASAAIIVRRGELDRRTARIVGIWSTGFAVVAALLCSVNLSILSYDSHMLVLWGQVLGADRYIDDLVLFQLSSWGVFLPVAQSLASLLPVEYLYGLSPVLGVSFVAVFALCFADAVRSIGFDPPPTRWVALVAGSLCTIFFFQHHFIYIHNNLATSVYLFGFVGLFWLAEVDRDTTLLPIAFLCLLACAIQRVETPLVALLFAVLAVFPSRLPVRALAAGLVAFTIPVAAWYALLSTRSPPSGIFLTKARCYLVIGLLVGALVLWLGSRRGPLRRATPRVAEIAVAVCALGLALAIAIKPIHMLVSVRSWIINLVVSDYWGLAWPLIAVLLVLAARLPRPPFGKLLSFGLIAAIAVMLMLAFGRHPYRAIHVGDSANRMMLHFLPIIFFYLGLKLVPLVRPAEV